MLRLEREEHERWWQSVAHVPPDAMRSDGWTLTEVLAHIAAWHRFAVERLERLARDEVLDPVDADHFNARVKVGSTGRSWSEVRAEADAAHRAFVGAIETVSQETLDARDALGAYVVGANGSFHYREHLEDTFDG